MTRGVREASAEDLARHGIAPERGLLEASIASVTTDQPGATVATGVRHPLHGGEDGLLHTLEAGEDAADLLLAHVERGARERGWRFLRSDQPAAATPPFRRRGWEVAALIVSKDLQGRPDSALAASPALIRRSGPGDRAFLEGLAARALRRGIRPCEAAVLGEGLLRAHARELVGRSSVLAMVAVCAGERAGHALCDVVWDRSTQAAAPLLLDTFVLDRFRDRGIGAALTAAVEFAARRNGFHRLGGSVVAPTEGAMEAILRGIEPDGWKLVAKRLVLPLSDRGRFDAATPRERSDSNPI